MDTRRKDQDWNTGTTGVTWDGAQLAVLMDIRDELKRLNAVVHCPNTIEIPNILRAIRRNTTKKRRARK